MYRRTFDDHDAIDRYYWYDIITNFVRAGEEEITAFSARLVGARTPRPEKPLQEAAPAVPRNQLMDDTNPEGDCAAAALLDAAASEQLPHAPLPGPTEKPKITLDVAYRFSNIHDLRKRQSELDFVDVLVDADIPLYLDPFAFKIGKDQWSIDCNNLVISFFQELVDALRAGDQAKAQRLLANLHEPNETRLGVSAPKATALPAGRGIGAKQAQRLYAAFANSKAVQTGILTDLSDCELFIEGISHDKISDVTVNIVRRKLVEFTQRQCELHGVPMETKPTGPCWDEDAKEWQSGYDRLPVYRGHPIILVPKAAVRYRLALDYREYYDKHVVDHIRQEYEAQECLNSSDSLTRVLRGGRRVTKKSVKEKNPISKPFLQTFSQKHPEVLAAYKEQAGKAAERGDHRPSDSGIYNLERTVAGGLNLFLIEEVENLTMNNNVHGDNFGAVGQGNRVSMRDVTSYKASVAAGPLDGPLKVLLQQAADDIEAAQLQDDEKEDARENLQKLTEELEKEKRPGVIRRCLSRLAEILPDVATVLASAATIAQVIGTVAS